MKNKERNLNDPKVIKEITEFVNKTCHSTNCQNCAFDRGNDNYHCTALLTLYYLNKEFKPKKHFTKDEIVIAKLIDKQYQYIARDRDGLLWLYKQRPIVWEGIWGSRRGGETASIGVFEKIFQSIKWEDTEPTLIADIVNYKEE